MDHAFEMGTDMESITTGSVAVDMISGIGGFPKKRVSEVFGWEASGKTTLCLAACAEAQRNGLLAAYIDIEKGVDMAHALRLGFDYRDEEKGLLISPQTFEETAQVIYELATSEEVDLIVVDSVPGMVPKSEIEGEIDATGALAGRARMLSQFLPRITKVIDEYNVALVFVNQMRMKPKISVYDRGPSEQASGGVAMRFFTSFRVDLELLKKGVERKTQKNPFTGKDEEVPVANLHRATAFKNKCAVPYRKAEFVIRYDAEHSLYGIDNVKTVADLSLFTGVVQSKAGGSISYTSAINPEHSFTAKGVVNYIDFLRMKPDIMAEILPLIRL